MTTNIESNTNLSHDYRRLTFNYDYLEKEHSRFCFSPPLSSNKSRDISMPRGASRHLYTDNTISHAALLKSLEPDLLSKARRLVNDAIMNKKIFTIFGPYERLRYCLKSRGWVEKLNDEKVLAALYTKLYKMSEPSTKSTSGDHSNNQSGVKDVHDSSKNKDYEEMLDSVASLLVLNCSPDLIWSLRLTQVDERWLKPSQMINHFKRAGSFTTKIGLIKSFNNLCWFEKNDDEVFPRSYILTDDNERKAFLDDYYLTACMGLIKITAEQTNSVSGKQDANPIDDPDSPVDKNNLTCESDKVKPRINYNTKEIGQSKIKIDRRFPEMAIHYCEFFLKYHHNNDLDQREVVFCSTKRWEEFFENYYNVTNEGYGVDSNDYIRERSAQLCRELKKVHSQYNLDGYRNIWIVKPGAKSRGRGIFCASKFSEINDIVRTTAETLIVQKYIESPLLVYKTKFDIRQWFLVTNWSPLTIWWYKDSYIRFCSQQFTLNDFNEAVHLSNNSIQHKYQNGARSKHLPSHNMWEWQNLEKYLDNNGHQNGWRKKILPSMKDIIIDVLLCSQEEIEDRKNSFELYGADFMVTADDLKTWLLEINSSPCMAASTDVTARLTKSVLEDVLKVLLDYPDNSDCDTGAFELLYRQTPFSRPIVECSDKLAISGTGIRRPIVQWQPMKRDAINIKKNAMHDDSVHLKSKLKQIVDSPKHNKDVNKVPESSTTSNEHRIRVSERNLYQMSLDLKNRRLQDYIEKDFPSDRRRTKSHNQEITNRQRSLIAPHDSKKLLTSPKLTNSTIVNETYKNAKFYGRSVPASKKDHEEETQPVLRNQQYNHTRSYDRYYKSKTLSEENSLVAKLQGWKQMDKTQNQRLHQILKAYLPYLD